MTAANFWASLGYHGETLTALTKATPQIMWSAVFYLIVCVIGIIGIWKVFEKAGVPGWKALIPYYNVWTLCKLTWKTDFFWIQLLCGVGALLTSIMQTGPMPMKVVWGVLSVVFGIALFIFMIIGNYRVAQSFGHGGGFTFGLIFLPFIFMLILGFGGDEYKGNLYMKQQK